MADQAGIDGVNISLDTLEPEAFFSLTGAHALDKVQAGLRQLLRRGHAPVKFAAPRLEIDVDRVDQTVAVFAAHEVD